MTSRPLRVFPSTGSGQASATLPRTNPPREADELYQKLRAVPQGDDKPWIQPWLAFDAKKNTARAMEHLTRHLLGSMILV